MPYDTNINLNADNGKNANDNFLSPHGFRLVIDKNTYADLEYKVQEASIPTLSVDAPVSPYGKGNSFEIGDRANYAPLELTFLVDENLKNYQEVHNWILGALNNPDDLNSDGKRRDITLQILSSHNNVVKEIQFTGAFPTTLSTLTFDSKATDIEYLTATVTFVYQYYKFL